MVETKVCLKMNGVGNALWLWQKKKKYICLFFTNKKTPPKLKPTKNPTTD